MLRLKPTTIIALDPNAAAFCSAVHQRLERSFGMRGRLIQTYALKMGTDTIELVSDVDSVADSSFDLEAARERTEHINVEEARALFERERVDKLEPTLIKMLESGRAYGEVTEAGMSDIDVANERMIYMVVPSASPVIGEIALDLAGLIRWLFVKLFTNEVPTVDVVVLLPQLFENPAAIDYAAAYALLKRLDYNATMSIDYSKPIFDNCWLIDSTNARGIKLGSLAENLESYSDAFAGFLTADYERSGALTVGNRPRGKVAAYSSFGHGELFFPAELTIKRLSSALARDIISSDFLADVAPTVQDDRPMLIAAKEFVLNKKYTDALGGIEREKGGLIWRQDFNPRDDMRGEMAAPEYVSELQHQHEKFESETLLGYNRSLLTSSNEAHTELVRLLDEEIDRRIDLAPNGLGEALKLVEMFVDRAIILKADMPNERPQNLITEQRAAQGSMDSRFGITINREKTKSILDRVYELRSRLSAMRTTLSLMPVVNGQQGQPPAQANRATANSSTANSSTATVSEDEPLFINEEASATDVTKDEQQRLIEEIEDAEQQLQVLYEEYPHAIYEEDSMAYHARRGASHHALEERAKAIVDAGAELITVGTRLNEARRVLNELQQERRQFLYRHFVLHPMLLLLILFGVPALAAFGDIGPARQIVEFFWDNLSQFLFWFACAAAAYASVIFYIYATGINRRVKEARDRVGELERNLKYSQNKLRDAHNEELRLKYELSLHDARVKTLGQLIKAAEQRITDLRQTIEALNEKRAHFTRMFDEAIPVFSTTRHPVLLKEDIDLYYRKQISDIKTEAFAFRRDVLQGKRSKVRWMSVEGFCEKLESFARHRNVIERLMSLSIEDVLLDPELVSANSLPHRLKALSDAAEPLVPLSDVNENPEMFAQRDVTLLAGVQEKTKLLDLFRRNCSEATIRISEDEKTLRALTRCLNFPAYFLGRIQYYRSCYERDTDLDPESEKLPDLIPMEMTVSPEVLRAHEQLLLGIAIGLVSRSSDGSYSFVNGKRDGLLGTDRGKIAEKFTTDFRANQIYEELRAKVTESITDLNDVHQRLKNFRDGADDLDSSEQELLAKLIQKYNPIS